MLLLWCRWWFLLSLMFFTSYMYIHTIQFSNDDVADVTDFVVFDFILVGRMFDGWYSCLGYVTYIEIERAKKLSSVHLDYIRLKDFWVKVGKWVSKKDFHRSDDSLLFLYTGTWIVLFYFLEELLRWTLMLMLMWMCYTYYKNNG